MKFQSFPTGDFDGKNLEDKKVSYTAGIKKYTSEEYRLTISSFSTTLTLYTIKNPKTFLVSFHDDTSSQGYPLVSECCITDLDCDIIECAIPWGEDIDKCLDLFSSILISSLFYEAICRTGIPLSFLTDNIKIVNEFISLCYKHWKLPYHCHPSFYIPEIRHTSEEVVCSIECKLKGDNLSSIIGFAYDKVTLQTDVNDFYAIYIPEIFGWVSESEGILSLIRNSFMWMILAYKGFNVGFGDNIKIKNGKDNLDLTYNNKPCNYWLQYPRAIQEVVDEINWDGNEEGVTSYIFSLYGNFKR